MLTYIAFVLFGVASQGPLIWPSELTRAAPIREASAQLQPSIRSASGSTDDKILALKYFQEAADLCVADGGKLWGVSLAGPMMFVEPQSRRIFANQADGQGNLKPDGELFVGELPTEIPVANYSLSWSGKKWTMVLWPLPKDDDARRALMMHESWHRIQSQIGLPPTGPDNSHLDKLDGRYWLQMEWRALDVALTATGDAQRSAIVDALQFRRHRRDLCSDSSAQQEQQLEMHEGIAEYSGVKLSGMSPEQQTAYVSKHLREKPLQYPSLTRSFAYLSGPAYGLLLDQVLPDWKTTVKPDTDLGDLLANELKIALPDLHSPEFESLAARYDHDDLWRNELERERRRLDRQYELRGKFVDGPVLMLPLNKLSFSFDPGAVEPLGGVGTHYLNARISDDWGILDVTGGVIKTTDGTIVRVVAPSDPAALPPAGDGWQLTLNDGWELAPGIREGDFVVQLRPAPDGLLEADRAFARATARDGLDGWLSFMADDAVRVSRPGEKLIIGKERIKLRDADLFADPNHKLVWEPAESHLFADGKIGVTTGRYRMIANDTDGNETVLSQGGYVTWWRKDADGKWKVIFDTGSPDPPE